MHVPIGVELFIVVIVVVVIVEFHRYYLDICCTSIPVSGKSIPFKNLNDDGDDLHVHSLEEFRPH